MTLEENTIIIDRFYQPDVTLGRLKISGFQCFTLELPWLNNQQNISCIPEGKYNYIARNSPRNGLVLQLTDVPNRTAIQTHSGNFTRQVKGCILVGSSIQFIDSDTIPDVSNSRNTLKALLLKAGTSGTILIRR